tara:strand:- start:234 stop:539 length:306 start_codon:yes stop_codon:yes gene_type:complete
MEISSLFIYVSLVLWQIGFIIGILLKLFYKPTEKRIKSTIVNTKLPAVEVELPKKKTEHVDIEMKKQITMDKASINNVVSDEVIKGKVKTQKDKLKQMRKL